MELTSDRINSGRRKMNETEPEPRATEPEPKPKDYPTLQ